jgi:hypothetical protein
LFFIGWFLVLAPVCVQRIQIQSREHNKGRHKQNMDV